MRQSRLDLLWFLACWLLAAIWCVSAAARLGATFDEPIYLRLGLERWRHGHPRDLLHVGTMPLPVDVQTLPLAIAERWRGCRWDFDADWPVLLTTARTMNLLFLGVFLAAGGWLGRQLGGPWGGRLATAWLACEPNLLAHAALATTDVALSAAVLLLAAVYRAGRTEPTGWGRRVGLPMLAFAACVLTKASGLAFGPLVILAVEVERWWYGVRSTEYEVRSTKAGGLLPRTPYFVPRSSYLADLIQILAGGLLLAVLYCGGSRPSSSDRAWLRDHLPAPVAKVAERLPLHRYAVDGLLFQVRHNSAGHGGAFLLGRWHPRPVWYYFPVALALKLSLPLLIAPLVIVMVRPRALGHAALLTALLLLTFSLTARVQIGVRLFLPLAALLAVGAATVLVQMRFGKALAVLAVAWTAAGAVAVWPHGLCFGNELAGGTRGIGEALADSNFDWGQGLPELADWARAHPDAPLAVWYFGSDPAALRPPFRLVQVHTMPLAEARMRVAGCYLAVGMSIKHGGPWQHEFGRQLEAMTPLDRTATFVIYDFHQAK